MDNNDKNFDLEWQKLRDEYQEMMKETSEEEVDTDSQYHDDLELDMNVGQIETPEVEEKEDPHAEIEALKQEKDLKLKQEREQQTNQEKATKKKIRQKKIINPRKAFNGMVAHTDKLLKKLTIKRGKGGIYLSDENRQELASMIVIFVIVMTILVICIGLLHIPQIAKNFFYSAGKDNITETEEMVYVDEESRYYHPKDCPHIRKGMRYLVLEEEYAIQLKYKPCLYIER